MDNHFSRRLLTLAILATFLTMAVPIGFSCAGKAPPIARFSAEPRSGTAPLEVEFTDESEGDIDDWEWDFGDGQTSSKQNPSHTYNADGEYTVSLTVTGPSGSDTRTKADYIEVSKVTIIIGNITDMTGVAAPASVPMTDALCDLVVEINAGLAPGIELPEGVELKVISYDTRSDPARFVPGYEWLKARGAHVIVSVFNDCSEALKPFAALDKVAILGMATSVPMVEPPGWVFGFSAPTRWAIKLMLEWIADQWEAEGKYETEGKPTIATVGWDDAWGIENEKGAREYCETHSDKFDYVGSYMRPVGSLTWSGEVSHTLHVDYVQTAASGALMPATFWAQYKQAGGTGINFDTESLSAYKGYITEYAGWPAWDGKLNVQAWGWWNLTQWDEVAYIKEVLYKYHSEAEADEWVNAGMGYLGGGAMQLFALQTVVAAINQVGVENFDGQAYYDTAINYMADWAGTMRGFTSDRRYAVDEMIVLEWDADAEDLIMISDGWLTIPHE